MFGDEDQECPANAQSSRNSRLRVFLLARFKPRLICFTAHIVAPALTPGKRVSPELCRPSQEGLETNRK